MVLHQKSDEIVLKLPGVSRLDIDQGFEKIPGHIFLDSNYQEMKKKRNRIKEGTVPVPSLTAPVLMAMKTHYLFGSCAVFCGGIEFFKRNPDYHNRASWLLFLISINIPPPLSSSEMIMLLSFPGVCYFFKKRR